MDYLFEDTTGEVTSTDFSDIHDGRFLRVRTTLIHGDYIVVHVYDFGSMQPGAFSTLEHHQHSSAVLTLHTPGTSSSLGTVKYNNWEEEKPVENYLRKALLSRYVPLIAFQQFSYRWRP